MNLKFNHHLVLGNPLPNPGHNCAFLDSTGQQSWLSSSCGKRMGYICYKDGAPPTPPQSTHKYFTSCYSIVSLCNTVWYHLIPYNLLFSSSVEQGFCPSPWIPYNGHCFHLQRVAKTWSGAQIECRKEGGDLVSIRNAEDQGFVISQLGYGT